MTSRLRWLGPPALFAALVLALCWRVWLAHRAFNWDALWSYWGDVGLQIQAARRGELPLWNPFDRCGFPFFADPQNGTLYPLQWPLVALGLVAGATWWLVAIKVMVHLWLWGLGMYVWLRRRGLPAAACVVAGVFCILQYPTTHGMFSALNWGMAWVPWVLLAVERWAERPDTRRAAQLALAVGMAWLVGAPASFWYLLLIAAPVGVWTLVVTGRAAARPRAYARAAVGTAALAGGLFVAMVAGQILAASALVPYTVRAARDLSFITESVLTSDNLFGLVVPRLPGIEMYFGMVNVFAALVALTVRPSGRTWLLAGIAAGGMLLAVGSFGGFLPGVASLLPPAALFRRAHRYVFVTMVPFAALAAEGLGVLGQLGDAEVRRRLARLLLALGGAGVVIFGTGALAVGGAVRTAFLLAAASWAGSGLLLAQLARTGKPGWLIAAAVVSCADVYAARLPQIEANYWPAPTTEHDAQAAALPGVPLDVRLYDREHVKYRAGARLGLRELGGYEGDPLELRRYAGLLALAYADPHLLGHANVGYVMGRKGPRPMAMPADFAQVGPDVWTPPRTAPAVAWYGAAQIVAGEEEALEALRTLVPGTGAILERPTLTGGESFGGPQPPVAGKLTGFGLDHLEAEVDAPAAGVVVVAEAYHPGWRATVDGQPAAIVPANGAFRGVLVGPGHHVLELRYPGGATPLLMALALLAMAAAAALALRRG